MVGLTISDILGYTSIACWLGAQFPQVLENIRRQSCEGLALPFLANWALGDLSNLIGCILTHQLPFQTLLAAYFVFVDFTLLVQYFYYYSRKSLARSQSHARTPSATIRRMPSIAPRYRTLSAVAANVAAAAALAAQQNEQADVRYSQIRVPRGSTDQPHPSSASLVSRETIGDDDGAHDMTSADVMDSFHSERAYGKRVSWSTERHSRRGGSASRSPVLSRNAFVPTSQATPTELAVGVFDALERGRTLQRELDNVINVPSESPEGTRRSSRGASRRGAGMVFLAIWAIFGVGTLTGNKSDFLSSSRTGVGRVLSAKRLSLIDGTFSSVSTVTTFAVVPHSLQFVHSDERSSDDIPPDDNIPHPQPSAERILGRIFAWLCTTLYLTSRLPQIWKNFTRKSVEGLSMYLFVFAFFGNVFYVASILSSTQLSGPPPDSTEFIKESIPYLLGSGGTLIFDITIVSQSFVYRPRPHHRGRPTRRKTVSEEEAALLGGDALAQPPLSSSALSQHGRGLAQNESTVQPRGWTLNSREDP